MLLRSYCLLVEKFPTTPLGFPSNWRKRPAILLVRLLLLCVYSADANFRLEPFFSFVFASCGGSSAAPWSYWATLFWQTFVHNFFLVRLNFKRLQVISWNYCLLMLKCCFSHAAWFICGMILANGKQWDPVIPRVNIGRFRLWTLNNKFEKIFDKIFVYNFLCRPLDFHLFISF